MYILLQSVAIILAVVSRSASHMLLEQAPLSDSPVVRNATISDAKAITNIIMAAFHDSAHWKYMYQFQDQFPDEHFSCGYNEVRGFFTYQGVLAQVALLPNVIAPHELTPVAVALWILPTAWQSGIFENGRISPSGVPMLAKCCHRDLNATRVDHFNDQFFAAKREYLDDIYPKRNQLYLNTLATHPKYQRQGAGSALLKAGLLLGRAAYGRKNITATLIASEAGEPLYSHLAWKSMRNFSVPSLDVINGTREHWRFDIMKHDLE